MALTLQLQSDIKQLWLLVFSHQLKGILTDQGLLRV